MSRNETGRKSGKSINRGFKCKRRWTSSGDVSAVKCDLVTSLSVRISTFSVVLRYTSQNPSQKFEMVTPNDRCSSSESFRSSANLTWSIRSMQMRFWWLKRVRPYGCLTDSTISSQSSRITTMDASVFLDDCWKSFVHSLMKRTDITLDQDCGSCNCLVSVRQHGKSSTIVYIRVLSLSPRVHGLDDRHADNHSIVMMKCKIFPFHWTRTHFVLIVQGNGRPSASLNTVDVSERVEDTHAVRSWTELTIQKFRERRSAKWRNGRCGVGLDFNFEHTGTPVFRVCSLSQQMFHCSWGCWTHSRPAWKCPKKRRWCNKRSFKTCFWERSFDKKLHLSVRYSIRTESLGFQNIVHASICPLWGQTAVHNEI